MNRPSFCFDDVVSPSHFVQPHWLYRFLQPNFYGKGLRLLKSFTYYIDWPTVSHTVCVSPCVILEQMFQVISLRIFLLFLISDCFIYQET